MQARLEGNAGEQLNLIGRLPRNSRGVELGGIHAGEDGDGEELGRMGQAFERRARGGEHGRTSGGVKGEHLGAEGSGGADGRGDGVGNVVQLEIEEDGETALLQGLENSGTGGDEELEAHFDPAARALETADEGFGGRCGGGVEGHDEPPARLFHGVKIRAPLRRSVRFRCFQTWHN